MIKITGKPNTFLNKLFKSGKRPYTSAVITVGGSGTRMQSADGKTKQFMTLCGIPVVCRTLITFQESEYIDEIVVVAKEDETELYKELIAQYDLTKITRIVKGGDTRQKSVLNGFRAISDKAEYVAVHDGVRCLITRDNIKDTVKAAYAHGSAAAAAKVYDTVKRINSDMFVVSTEDRDTLMTAQTPQVFYCNIYRAAAFSARRDGFEATDDCMLAEEYGFKVKLVDCGRENIKITTKTDLLTAEAILRSREENITETEAEK